MDLNAVNSMNYEEFVDIFGNVVEKCPLITGAIWSKFPFSSVADLEASVYEFIDSLPSSGKEGILRCHPDLAGRELMSGTLTTESLNEQNQAGLTSLSQTEREALNVLNSQYKTKFGFPFVICAKMSDKSVIIEELRSRLQNNRDEELGIGIAEVKKICHLRLQDIFLKVIPTKL
ncbi:putative 2-oxo-4-hydroxy-4-carboxy-5-ureidoimidazoline decarboxylase [Pelobates fuscus]|uniref:putative 2-oxo-4-hydroxy-4-carboxy-5-ureidoimidazoline decarboxylase n=1 Tax=Pelobates fuscus TaxID=191477 RepID=UPI002FE453A9